jgi:hypothetical protein
MPGVQCPNCKGWVNTQADLEIHLPICKAYSNIDSEDD